MFGCKWLNMESVNETDLYFNSYRIWSKCTLVKDTYRYSYICALCEHIFSCVFFLCFTFCVMHGNALCDLPTSNTFVLSLRWWHFLVFARYIRFVFVSICLSFSSFASWSFSFRWMVKKRNIQDEWNRHAEMGISFPFRRRISIFLLQNHLVYRLHQLEAISNSCAINVAMVT